MRYFVPILRVPSLALLAATALVATSGCGWFHKRTSNEYALPPQARPLEVPPDLNLPDTSGAMKVPGLAASAPPSVAIASASTHTRFAVSGERDAVFAKVGAALADIPGLTIASKAQLLGSYEVGYEGASFLVRVVKTGAGSEVSAVDARGMPANAEAAVKLIAALKAQLGR